MCPTSQYQPPDTCHSQPAPSLQLEGSAGHACMCSNGLKVLCRMLQLQVGLALQAVNLTVASERKADVELTPEAAQVFTHFWQAHAGCPLLGRNKVGRGSAAVLSCTLLWYIQCALSQLLARCMQQPVPAAYPSANSEC